MNTPSDKRIPLMLAYGLPALIVIASVGIAKTSLLSTYPELAVGVTYDLTITAPLVYLIFIRKTNVPNITALSVFGGGIFLATFLLPAEGQTHLDLIKRWLLPVAELFVLGYIGVTVYRTVRTVKTFKAENSDLLKVIYEVCRKVTGIPFFANALAFEVSVLYYVFFGWREPAPDKNAFTYHKKGGKIALLLAIILIIAAETFVLHIIVALWSKPVAWILSLLSIYVILQLFAHLKALRQRPVEISGDKLIIRYGLFAGTQIERENIERIEITSVRPAETEGVRQVALLGGLEQFNVLIRLKKEAEFTGIYGMKAGFTILLLFVDEPGRFKNIFK